MDKEKYKMQILKTSLGLLESRNNELYYSLFISALKNLLNEDFDSYYMCLDSIDMLNSDLEDDETFNGDY